MDSKKSYTFQRPEYFDLNQIFDCGQCFRFEKCDEKENLFEGIAYGKYISIAQTVSSITITGTDAAEFDRVWKHYFAIDESYIGIRDNITKHLPNDAIIRSAMEKGKGIRILRQEPWETVCSFIISQNNNIPRIKKIISALSEAFGEKILYGNKIYYAFPTAESLYEAGEEKIFALKTGFRAGYLYDAAKKVVTGELNLDRLSLYDTDELIQSLMSVKGIGPKVAACTALFGFGKNDAFPIDVWMKKVISKYYPGGLNRSDLGEYAGIAQQYLFYYERFQVEKT